MQSTSAKPSGEDYRRLSAAKLRPAVKAVLGVLMRDGLAARQAGLLWLADRAGISRRSVETALRDLEAFGLVSRSRRRWQTVIVILDTGRALQWLRDLWEGSRSMFRQALAAAVAAKAARMALLWRGARSASSAQSSVTREKEPENEGEIPALRLGDVLEDGRKVVGWRKHGRIDVPVWG